MPPLVIAIDGPAGAGKSTTAREVASRLGLLWVDTGAMYRAVTLWLLRHGIAPVAGEAIEEALGTLTVDLVPGESTLRVLLCGEDVSQRIRDDDVTGLVSQVSSLRQVRHALVRWQRRIAERGNVVMEGRDIGTVVCPDAPIKIFLEASLATRARRRARERSRHADGLDERQILRELARRDTADSTREVAPMAAATDAVRLDTTNLSITGQVDAVVRLVRERGYVSS
ncbi:(d)CMP kinase [Candidatus Fermentibacteria bacterium]|nr:(d)CMP kinase [Candidatus Fermentibacteria bacterium]